jgi:hypothetical protein
MFAYDGDVSSTAPAHAFAFVTMYAGSVTMYDVPFMNFRSAAFAVVECYPGVRVEWKVCWRN